MLQLRPHRMKLKKLNESFEEHENDELWAISYGDMITLLLSFFVIFFSTDFKKNQQDKLDEHLMSAFKVSDIALDKKYPKSEESKEKIKTELDAPKFEILKDAKITKIDDRLLVTFNSLNFFDSGVTEPNKNGEEMLNAFAKKYLPYAGMYKLSIKAFTDKRPVSNRHRFKDNMELSALRALSALRILQKSGIPLNRLEIAGYGEMDRLKSLIDEKQIKKLTDKEVNDISRTLIIIIKHDNEQGIL